MKVRSKDEIIKCLIDILSETIPEEQKLVHEDNAKTYYTDIGWVECLKWVLQLSEEEKEVFVEGKNTLVVKEKTTYAEEQIREAVDIAIGDDGHRSKEVIEILKTEVYASDRNKTN